MLAVLAVIALVVGGVSATVSMNETDGQPVAQARESRVEVLPPTHVGTAAAVERENL